MIVKVIIGAGKPGKLWRGSVNFFGMKPDGEHDSSLDGVESFDVEFVENWSENGATTRRLFGQKANVSAAAAEALDLPILYVSAGGVGSVADGVEGTRTWNWSKRTSGNVVMNPLMIHRAKVWELERSPLPTPRPGFAWIKMYDGVTIREYVLVGLDEDGNIHPHHLMPVIRWHRATLSPPEQRDLDAADTADADDLAARWG